MFTCPTDQTPLTRARSNFGVVWLCSACGGRALGMGVLRKAITPEAASHLWVSARNGNGAGKRPCPSCLRPMVEVGAASSPSPHVDVCRTCHFLWFDPSEYESLPAQLPHAVGPPPVPEEAREILATARAESIAEAYHRDGAHAGPDEMWKYMPALLGMPVEYENSVLARLPWMTWAVAALATGVSVAGFFHLREAIGQYGLVPAQAWRHGGLTFLTSFLLHGSIFHLISNMYFLLVFGDNVEDALGKGRYLALLLFAALAGDMAHIALDPRAEIPVIGASGGISGIVLYYALKYPRAQLGILLRIFFYFRWVRIPAFAYVGIWVLLQLLGAYQQVAGVTNVSALAHLGGAAVGAIFWWANRL